MKEKVLTREKLQNMKAQIISVDSSSSQDDSESVHSHEQHSKRERANNSSEENSSSLSSSGSEVIEQESSQQNIFRNLAPDTKDKKTKSLTRLRGLFFNENLGSSVNYGVVNFNKLNKAEVDALYMHVDSKSVHSEESVKEKQKNSLPEKNRKKDDQKEQKRKIKKMKKSRKRRPSLTQLEFQDSNNKSLSNQSGISVPKKKPRLMEQLQADLAKPTDQESKLRRKRQNRKREYLFQKKQKQLKVGKKKDQMSNTVFNAIQDYFN